jgi:hypothetical protein
MRRALVAILVTVAAAGATAGQADASWKWSHRVTISGQFVNHWSVTDPGPCGTNGDGTVTVTFKNKKTIHTFVNKVPGTNAWILVGLYHGQTTFLPRQPAIASITTVDNSAPANQPAYLDSCDPIDKSRCGTKQLRKPSLSLGDLDATRLRFDVFGADFRDSGCQFGSATRFGDVDFFGHKTPELPIKMPSFRSFKRKRSVTVTGTSHDVKSVPDLDATITNDVTRTVTVTFTKR